MAWTQAGAGWSPIAAVLAITAIALVEAILLPARARLKLACAACVLVCGLAAIVGTVRQQRATAAFEAQTMQVQDLWTRLDALGALVRVGRDANSDEIFDAVIARIAGLNTKVASIESELRQLQERVKSRFIDHDVAMQMADYLRQFGSHRVVVSCLPGNVEAYNYANQIANILRGAGWDALGPETTAIFGNAPGIGVNVYIRGSRAPDAIRILLEAFAKFNIPYQSRVEPSQAIPDSQTVELFIAAKP